jgi:hypothetical protein
VFRLPNARVAAGEDRTIQPLRRAQAVSIDASVELNPLDSTKSNDAPLDPPDHVQESPSTQSHRETPSYFDRLHEYRSDHDRHKSSATTPRITPGRFRSPSLPPPRWPETRAPFYASPESSLAPQELALVGARQSPLSFHAERLGIQLRSEHDPLAGARWPSRC